MAAYARPRRRHAERPRVRRRAAAAGVRRAPADRAGRDATARRAGGAHRGGPGLRRRAARTRRSRGAARGGRDARRVRRDPGHPRSPLPARDPHQPGEPREGRARAGARRAGRARLAHLPRQGPQRGGRHRAAPRLEPAGAARVLARPARLQHGSAAGADDLGHRCRRPLARPGAVRQAAAGRRPLRPGGRVPHPPALVTRRRQTRGDAGCRRRPGLAGHRLPQRRADPLHRPAVGRRDAPRP